MFRAITGYFFGGATEEEPQSSLETQEVNDWLVVNMTDRTQNDMVMIESTRPDPMSESEYEDVLDAVSCLMRPVEEPELEPSDGESTVESSDCEELDEEVEEEEEEVDEEEEEEDRLSPKQHRFLDRFGRQVPEHGHSRGFLAHPLFRELLISYPTKVDSYYPEHYDFKRCRQITEQEVVQHFETAPSNTVKTRRVDFVLPMSLHQRYKYSHARQLVEDAQLELIVDKVAAVIESPVEPSRRKFLQELKKKMNEAKQGLNWLEKIGHTIDKEQAAKQRELQKRIDELEHEQIVKRHKHEKVITRGQMNRQNKNYLFQSSCKKNRRRDLQRNHSGANNNRKCSC